MRFIKMFIKSNIQNILYKFGFKIQRIDSTFKQSYHSYDNTFERLKFLSSIGFSPTLICDIGASDGRWTRKCLEVFGESNYFLVEPQEEYRDKLQVLADEFPHNITYNLGCLGEEESVAIINVDGDGTSVLSGHWGNPYGQQREVNVYTLDSLLTQNNLSSPSLIKIDVQGYELKVLKGSKQALLETDIVILEVSFFSFQDRMPIFHEVIAQMEKYGFIVYDILSLNLRPLDQATAQSDILFMKKTCLLCQDIRWDTDSTY